MKNKKLSTILKPIGYFILLLAICASAALFFHSYYYDPVYISGSSMSPTLNGADEEALVNADGKGSGVTADFGIMDAHQSALKHLKRFDIISTYYQDDYYMMTDYLKAGATRKIKRIIGMPNETIKIEKGLLYVLNEGEYQLIPYTFKINPSIETEYTGKDIEEVKLEEDEYWVLGDNRQASRDSATVGKIYFKDIKGVLIAVEGRGELYVKQFVCESCGQTYKYSKTTDGICDKCSGQLRNDYDIKNKHYHWPKYF